MNRAFLFLLAIFLGVPSLAQAAVVVRTRITPENGIVTIGQIVKMVIEITNDSDEPIPGITLIRSSEINGLSGPQELPPCDLVLSLLNPPSSPIAYSMSWFMKDLQPRETRVCDITFQIRTLPNGRIPIFLGVNLGSLVLSATFRSAPPLMPIPVPVEWPALLFLAVLLSTTAIFSIRSNYE